MTQKEKSMSDVKRIVENALDAGVAIPAFNIPYLPMMEPVVKAVADLNSFAMEIVLNRRLAPGHSRRLEFVERELDERVDEEPGLKEFLRNRDLSGDLAEEEARFLRSMRFKAKRPTPLYYYRALQNLRDPLHFRDE